MNSSIKYELWEVTGRLTDLGLNVGILRDSVRRGCVAAASCTPYHPPLYRGIVGWGEIVCALREYLTPEKWWPSDESNYSRVINEKGTIAITVATGDEFTGQRDASPSTRSLKGPLTASAVTLNQLQMDLFTSEQAPAPQDHSVPEGCLTYMLLVYRDQSEVRCELSLPDRMTDEGRVVGWRERIIIGSIPLDGEPVDITPPSQPDLDIDVKRRTS